MTATRSRRPRLRSFWIPSVNIARQIAAFEGGRGADGRFHPYFDRAGGVWTQGFGHTGHVRRTDTSWSLAKATLVLVRDLASPRYGGAVNRRLKQLNLRVSRKFASALVDTVYNAGPGVLGPSWKLGRALERYAREKTPINRGLVAAALRHTAVTGAASGPTPLAGLVRRRDKAADLLMGGAYWFNG
jgi:GH24 family phage-related lysozyme (muramidase)